MPVRHARLTLFCAILLVAAASLSLLGCGGCAGTQARQTQTQSSGDTAPGAVSPDRTLQNVPVLPQAVTLSPRGGATYSYLLLLQAFLREDEAALLDAIPQLKESQAPPQTWLEAGVWLMGRKSANAVVFLEQSLMVWPEEVSLNLLCAEALAEHNMADRGVALMHGFLQKHPNSLDARLELALLLVKTRQFTEAENLLESVNTKERTPLVDYYHARALIGMGRQAEAVPLLQKTIKHMPDFAEALAELAFTFEQLNELNKARDTYEKLARLDFPGPDLHLRLINLSLRLNQPQKALQYMKKGPNNDSFRLTVASMMIESRHYPHAETLLKSLITKQHTLDDAHLLLADLTWTQHRNLQQSLAWLDKVSPDGKTFARALLMRAQLLTEAEQHANALGVLKQGQQDFDHMFEFFEFEIRLLAGQRKMPEALLAARKACERWPDNGDLAFLFGSLLDENGDKSNAFKVMETLTVKQPDHYQALNYVGYTLAEEGRELERALQMLVRANTLAPDQAYIVDSLAWVLYKLNRNEEAFTQIRRAADLNDQNDPTIWEHYGDIALSLGKKAEARKAYEKALKFKPANNESIQQRLSRL
ncbi:MAG: tetratricopeptide repeat protein [Desulfovibrio sp.]|nr:tetratricopeptide repeat protein [Desulfovibrio sp.]